MLISAECWRADTEQPTLREWYLEADSRRQQAENRFLQELESLCALSTPRVAFEMRLIYLPGQKQELVCLHG
jgi:hypothetical protein